MNNKSEAPLLRLEGLQKYFEIPGKGSLHAVDGISLDIMPHETLGLVGESGCGKSTVGNVLMNLLPATGGHAYFDGIDIVGAKGNNLTELRKKMQIIFQDPYSSLNPRKTIYSTLAAPFKVHHMAADKRDLDNKVKELARMVGLEEYVLKQYPHELDGGKRQMVGIARSFALNPSFIVCDEPVSSLDVSVQATIINLLIELQKQKGMTYLFISHDLSVVRHISNRVAVMYLGQIVELADTDEIFSNTMHPYSIALLSAVPRVEFKDRTERIVLKGDVPSPMNPEPGCRFAPRCWMSCAGKCKGADPKLEEITPGHYVACPYWKEAQEAGRELMKK
ncbi:MAG: ATP-binding cassette domain-containing protein [Lachnospiraceae bacterium]|nr:ATP-binding cassette domain-containing protein [Lachnospiraceae bacterium]